MEQFLIIFQTLSAKSVLIDLNNPHQALVPEGEHDYCMPEQAIKGWKAETMEWLDDSCQ